MGEAATYPAAIEGSALPFSRSSLKEGKAHLGVEGADVPDDQDTGGDLSGGSEDSTTTVGDIRRAQTKA